MSSEYVVCDRCGGDFKVAFSNISRRDREWRVKNWNWTCSECWEKAKADANAKAAAEAEKIGLPELVGTKAQVIWAESLRMDFVKDITLIVKDGSLRRDISRRLDRDVNTEEIDRAIVHITGRTSASYWIDKREDSARWLVLGTLEKMKSPEDKAADEAKKDFELMVAAEATVRRENPVTETVAEIGISRKNVWVRFPEKRGDFRQIMKFDLGFSWAGKRWERDCSAKTTGCPEDRAVEVGHVLLVKGFCVRVFDETLRGRVVKGDFDPECKKWILVRSRGVYKGWFAVWWKREVGDYYREAKILTRSVWDKPSVVVPSEYFEDVLDFAECNKFRISDDAANLIEQARQARDSMFVTNIEYAGLDHEKRLRNDGKPPVLAIPEVVALDPELMDV